MVEATGVSFIDGKGIGPKTPQSFTYRVEGVWYVEESGPNYRNTWRVTSTDDRGAEWLLARERKVEPTRVCEEPKGHTWICPRCAYPLDKVGEGATMDLWECAQCGWIKVVKGERG